MNTTKRVNTNKEAEARRLAAKAKQNAAYWANKKRSEKALEDIKKKHELKEAKKQKDETEEQAEKRIKKETKVRKMQEKAKKNAFAALCSDTESEAEDTAAIEEEETTAESIPKNTWAGLVKGEFKVERKPAPQPQPTLKRKITLNKPVGRAAPWASPTETAAPKKSWAEMCDESSDEEDDNIYTGNDAW